MDRPAVKALSFSATPFWSSTAWTLPHWPQFPLPKQASMARNHRSRCFFPEEHLSFS
jgi:hypothetical protein